jgi:hypothetical protein
MNLGQLPLVVGALCLLATLALSVNSSILNATMLSLDTEATVSAMSIGQAMLDEILSNPGYDQTTLDRLVTDRSVLTIAAKLGPDSTEVVPANEQEPFKSNTVFNDVDDYNKYTRRVFSTNLGMFTVRDSVFYVQETNLSAYSSSPTWFKKIQVTVSHPNLARPLVLKQIMVYRRFLPSAN